MGVLKIYDREYDFKTIDNVDVIQEKIDILFLTLKLMGYKITTLGIDYSIFEASDLIIEVNSGVKRGKLQISLSKQGDVVWIIFTQFEEGDPWTQDDVFDWPSNRGESKLIELFDKFLVYI